MNPALLFPFAPDDDSTSSLIETLRTVLKAVNNPTGFAVDSAISAAGDGLVGLWANAIAESVGQTFITLGTWWVNIKVPNLYGSGSSVSWMQQQLSWIVIAMVAGSVMIAGIQTAWMQRAEPARELLRHLLTIVVVTSAGAAVANLIVKACDEFAIWMLDAVTQGSAADFGKLIVKTSFSSELGGASKFVVIIMGLLAVVANLVQMAMMLMRAALLPVMVSVLPFAASASNTTWGKAWLTKIAGWFLAFALYKPVASIVYALAIKMTASGSMDELDEFGQFAAGMFLMIAATIALPALVAFMVPATAAVAAGGGGAGGMAAYGMVQATGAITSRVGRGGSGPQGTPGASGTAGGAGASGASGSAGARGASGAAGAAGAAGSSGTALAATGPAGVAVGAAAKAGMQAVGAARGAITSATGAASSSYSTASPPPPQSSRMGAPSGAQPGATTVRDGGSVPPVSSPAPQGAPPPSLPSAVTTFEPKGAK